jgi:hypothetical protein
MGLTTIRSAKGVAFSIVNSTLYPRLQSSDATADRAAEWVRCVDLLSLACSGLFVIRAVYIIPRHLRTVQQSTDLLGLWPRREHPRA